MFRLKRRSRSIPLLRLIVALAFVLLSGMPAVGAGTASVAEAANPAANLDQCANGTAGSPAQCTGSAWVNGDLNPQNSHWREGDSVPFRIRFSNLGGTPQKPASHALQIQWDTT